MNWYLTFGMIAYLIATSPKVREFQARISSKGNDYGQYP